ncbi:hypothetical protein ACI3ET_06325 [Ornithinimicrobium sp. LYQ121]|uniref:hypothetical protein n=1 Tax=Ornithinimicrobium sp. LYQ121 TaxID=3378801 RepID=UPI0038535E85
MRLLVWCALLVSLVVQVVGLYSGTVPGPESLTRLDKINHLVGFAVPAALAWWLGARWIVGVLVLHALVSEPLQGWLASLRHPDVLDTVADLLGLAVGVGVVEWLRRARTRRSAMMGEDGGHGRG